MVLQFLIIVLGVLNIQVFLNVIKVKISNYNLLKPYLLSWGASSFLPGRVGEFSLTYFLKEKARIGDTTAILLLDKIVTFVVIILFGLTGLIYFVDKSMFLIFLFASLIILFGVLSIFFSSSLRNFIKRFILRKYSYVFKGFSKTGNQILRSKRAMAVNFLLTVIRLVFTVLTYYVAFLTIDPSFRINPLAIMFISSAVTLTAFIPISISGVGIKEGTAVILYGLVGVSPELTFSAHLLLLIMRYVYSSLFFIFIKT